MKTVKEVVSALQDNIPDSSIYLEGECLNFAAAAAMACKAQGLAIPIITILFRDQWEEGVIVRT